MVRLTRLSFGLILAAAAFAAGCGQVIAPANKPLSAEARAALAAKGMREDMPIFVRIFKEESELEIWKLKEDGAFHHFKSYPICRWSGDLGPKEQQGDKQAPEGFYTVNVNQMNPNSNYYLSFNIGFPNAYDKAHDRSGAHLMVHGDCKSAGCYAMTDALMEEIYILAREAFKGGQESFGVHAYPFRMTADNLKRHRDHRWYAFWRTLKEGHDYFEKTHRPPPVEVCERRYLVNVAFNQQMSRVDPKGPCPAYRNLPIEAFPPPIPFQEASAKPKPEPGSIESVRDQSVMTISPAQQSTVGQGKMFTYAPANTAVGGFSFRSTPTLGR